MNISLSRFAVLTGTLVAFATTSVDAADTSSARKTFIKDELTRANAALSASVREEKFQAMSASAYAFFRGSVSVYYKDIQSGVIPVPSSWPGTANIKTWGSGDAHPMNFGYFDNKNGVVTFDMNDFDESYIAPFYFDTVRCVTGIHLTRGLTSGWTLSLSEAEDIAFNTFMTEYQNLLSSVNGNSSETTTYLDSAHLSGIVKSKCDSLASNNTNTQLLDKYTTINSLGKRVFNFTNSDLLVLSSTDASELNNGWSSYLSSIGSFYSSKPSSYWTIKDWAIRLHSGLGSLGNKKYYILIEGPSSGQNDDVLLEVKQENRPSMLDSALSSATTQYSAWFTYHGVRALTANKASLAALDDHYGYLIGSTYSYLVRRISPYKYSFDTTDFPSKSDYTTYIKYVARAMAYAHARSDKDYNSGYVNYNAEAGILNAISVWPSAKTTMCTLGENYADQVRADWSLFLQLRSEGSL